MNTPNRDRTYRQVYERPPWELPPDVVIPGEVVMLKNNRDPGWERRGHHRRLVIKTRPRWNTYKAYAAGHCVARRQRLGRTPLHGLLHVVVRYYPRDRSHWPDLSGLHEVIGDILEAGGVIHDDQQIRNWDGSRIMEPDRGNPREEIWIRPHAVAQGEATYLAKRAGGKGA